MPYYFHMEGEISGIDIAKKLPNHYTVLSSTYSHLVIQLAMLGYLFLEAWCALRSSLWLYFTISA